MMPRRSDSKKIKVSCQARTDVSWSACGIPDPLRSQDAARACRPYSDAPSQRPACKRQGPTIPMHAESVPAISYLLFCLALVALVLAPSGPAFAQETQPGDTCTAGETDLYRLAGGPENPGTGYLLECDGATWNAVLTWDTATGMSLFQVGNDTAACDAVRLGRIRYNGTSTWEYCNGASWDYLSPAAGNTGEIQFNSGGGFAADSALWWDNTNKWLGIGTQTQPTSLTKLAVDYTDTSTAGGWYWMSKYGLTLSPSGAQTGVRGALAGESLVPSGNANSVGMLLGVIGSAVNDSNVSVGRLIGNYASARSSAGSVGNMEGVFVYGDISNAGSTIDNSYGLRIEFWRNSGSATVTNRYGIHINGSPDVGATNDYGIYQALSGSSNYFAGDIGVGIGTTTAAIEDKLHVAGGQIRIDNDTDNTNKGCIRYDGTGNKLQFSHDCSTYSDMGSGGGGGAFTDLSDTPSSYSGNALKHVRVNSAADALEFVDGGGGSGLWSDSGSGYIEYSSALGGVAIGGVTGLAAPIMP